MTDDFGHWLISCENPGEEIPYGFIYKITRIGPEREGEPSYYIGKQQCWNQIRRKPLKGKTRVRVDQRPSNWKRYCGSCKKLNESIADEGKESFSFEILEWCDSKWELAWRELQYQVEHDVLRDPQSYNGIIHVRIGSPPKESKAL